MSLKRILIKSLVGLVIKMVSIKYPNCKKVFDVPLRFSGYGVCPGCDKKLIEEIGGI